MVVQISRCPSCLCLYGPKMIEVLHSGEVKAKFICELCDSI